MHGARSARWGELSSRGERSAAQTGPSTGRTPWGAGRGAVPYAHRTQLFLAIPSSYWRGRGCWAPRARWSQQLTPVCESLPRQGRAARLRLQRHTTEGGKTIPAQPGRRLSFWFLAFQRLKNSCSAPNIWCSAPISSLACPQAGTGYLSHLYF